MTDMNKRTLIKLAAFSAMAGVGGMLVGCGEADNKSNSSTDNNVAPTDAQKPLKVGFMYIGPVGDGGWSYSHDLGRKHIEKVFGDKIQTSYVESVPEGPDAEHILRDLVDQGNKLIFGTTFGYMESMLRVAADHPDVYFEHATGHQTANNLRVYDHRLYEAAYQAGVVAAYMSKTKTLGFVGTFPLAEVLRNVNAYTLGARSVNPEIKVKLVWVHNWYNPTKEGDAAKALFTSGADVVLQNTDSSAVLQATEQAGHYGFGWDSDMSHYAPEAHLASCVLDWGLYYEKAVREALENTWKTDSIRWGAKEGLVQFAHVSDKVTGEARNRVEQIQEGLKAGTYHIFKGPLLDNTGTERLAAGQIADVAWESNVNFLVEGIDGTIDG